MEQDVKEEIFSKKDIEILKKCKKPVESAKKEFEVLKKGVKYVKIADAATIKNGGIKIISKEDFDMYIKKGEDIIKEQKVLRFSPASGAGSRMFAALAYYHNNKNIPLEEIQKKEPEYHRIIKSFHENIDKFAFYNQLKEIIEKNNQDPKDLNALIRFLLFEEGLNYNNIQKAFMPLHKYSNGEIKDMLEEHICEAANIGITKFHFTFPPENEDIAVKRLEEIKRKYKMWPLEISHSLQEHSTDTISLDLETQKPFRKQNGELLLRTGGHGALLPNINKLKNEIIVFKNIDNIGKQKYHILTRKYMKAIIGYIYSIKEKVHKTIEKIQKKEMPVFDACAFIEKELCIKIPESFYELDADEQYKIIFEKLNRPIKVVLVVPNKGEPGGGPTWISGKDGFKYLRITEQSEAEGGKNNPFMKDGTHFNPVNLTLYLKDYKGNFFDLQNFVNWESCFISEKFAEGKKLRALELPGLWNGSMEDFITIFVEAPLESFQPLKYVDDFLREGHQAQKD